LKIDASDIVVGLKPALRYLLGPFSSVFVSFSLVLYVVTQFIFKDEKINLYHAIKT